MNRTRLYAVTLARVEGEFAEENKTFRIGAGTRNAAIRWAIRTARTYPKWKKADLICTNVEYVGARSE